MTAATLRGATCCCVLWGSNAHMMALPPVSSLEALEM